jgi:hypothetical protein
MIAFHANSCLLYMLLVAIDNKYEQMVKKNYDKDIAIKSYIYILMA